LKAVLDAARSWTLGSLAALGAAVVIGYLPTLRLGGAEAVAALAAGCGVALFGALCGAAPVLVAVAGGRSSQPHVAALLAMALRAGATLVGVVAVALGTELPRVALGIWVAIGYAVLLVVETRWTLRWLVAGDAK